MDLELIYPSTYSKRKRRFQDEFLVVTNSNFFEFCKEANRQFEFLIKHEQLPGIYFVDWRLNFYKLHQFISKMKRERSSIFYHHQLERLLHYYQCSERLIYSRN